MTELVSQMRQKGDDPVGQWTREIYELAGGGMQEGKPRGVEGHAPQALDQVGGKRIAFLPGPVGRVANQRMTKGREANADLMRPAGLEPALQIGESRVALEDAEPRHRALARARTGHGHAHSRAGIAGDGGIDHALVAPD